MKVREQKAEMGERRGESARVEGRTRSEENEEESGEQGGEKSAERGAGGSRERRGKGSRGRRVRVRFTSQGSSVKIKLYKNYINLYLEILACIKIWCDVINIGNRRRYWTFCRMDFLWSFCRDFFICFREIKTIL